MPLFRGFRFSLNLTSGKQFSEFSEEASPVSIKGAYKLNNEEFFGLGSYGDPPKKITPSMVKLPPALQSDKTKPDIIIPTKNTGNLNKTSQAPNIPPNLKPPNVPPALKSPNVPPNYKPPDVPHTQPPNISQTLSKSTPEISGSTQTSNLPQPLRKVNPEVSSDPKGEKTSNRNSTDVRNKKNKNDDKIQKRLDKKREVEIKKLEKKEAQERAKQEKIEKAREKANLKEIAKQEKLQKAKQKAEELKAKKEKKNKTPEPKPLANNPLAQTSSNPVTNAANPLARNTYNSNTLDSSISKTSGPPPYKEVAESKTMVQNERDSTGNTSFGKPVDEGSTWDMVAQHRAQVNRAAAKSRVQLLDNERSGPRESLEV